KRYLKSITTFKFEDALAAAMNSEVAKNLWALDRLREYHWFYCLVKFDRNCSLLKILKEHSPGLDQKIDLAKKVIYLESLDNLGGFVEKVKKHYPDLVPTEDPFELIKEIESKYKLLTVIESS